MGQRPCFSRRFTRVVTIQRNSGIDRQVCSLVQLKLEWEFKLRRTLKHRGGGLSSIFRRAGSAEIQKKVLSHGFKTVSVVDFT